MKISARNVFPGTVKSIQDGTVYSEVVVEISPGLEIVATVTKGSKDALGIEIGKPAHAIIKASNVMLGVD